MKRILLVTMAIAACMMFGGCGSGSSSGGVITGAVAGAGALLQETFAGAEADLERYKQQKIEELKAANARLAAAVDEAEKIAAAAEVKALKKKVENLSDAQGGVELAKEGTKVDWTDPAAVGGYGSTVIATALAYIFRKKHNTEATKRSAEKVGREKTINELAAMPKEDITAEIVTSKLFNNIGQERANQKVA